MDNITSLLAPYVDLQHLECDGLTRVASHLLTKAQVPHTVMRGRISHRATGRSFTPHYWVDLADGRRIDYRARRWLGEREDIPHGVFQLADYPEMDYQGRPDPSAAGVLSEQIFRVLVTPFPSMEQFKQSFGA